jgi:hypothetical protein
MIDSIKKAVLNERLFLIVCIVLGAVQCWICRYTMLTDGMSYLDIGDAYFRRDWAGAINAYWSPLYSWFLGFAMFLFKPSIWWEFITVHIVNSVIYVLALFCVRFFLHAVLRALREDNTLDESLPLSECSFLALGYSVFLWCGIMLADVGRVLPDLLAACPVFLIVGYLVELRTHHSYLKYVLFGALNAVAYFGKGINFILAFGFLAIVLFSGRISKARVAGTILAGVTFLLVSSPFILALSKAKGRFTVGDTGKLVYSALVYPNKAQIHWQGDPPGSGVPLHPTRQLLDDPPVFEFAEPVLGTYPPWDDPSYWNDGTRWNFRLRSQIRVLVQSALAYTRIFMEESALIVGLLVFLLLGGRRTMRAIASNWPLLTAAALALVAYSFVYVIPRYIAASMVLLWVALLGAIRLPKNDRSERISNYVAAAVTLVVLASVLVHIADTAYDKLTVTAEPSGQDQIKTALGLENLGLRPGDKVSVIGLGNDDHWARLARFRIVSEIAVAGVEARQFWAAPTERRNLSYECLSRTGAKVVVAWNPPSDAKNDPRWKQIADTNYYALFFSR